MTYTFPVIQGVRTGMKLKQIRKSRGVSVPVICRMLGGITEQAVYKWERGDSLPTIDNLLALSRFYHIPMEDLLVYEETEQVSYFFARSSGSRQISGSCRICRSRCA